MLLLGRVGGFQLKCIGSVDSFLVEVDLRHGVALS